MGIVDWSATAAWTAVAVSIGTVVVVPVLTSIISGIFQLLIRKLEARDHRRELGVTAIDSAISSIGRCASCLNVVTLQEFGSTYFSAYAYVDSSLWPELNSFYSYVIDENIENVALKAPEIILLLTDARGKILKS